MFKATPANPYDDIVVKATDEAMTGENWGIILNLCDKVQDEGEQGARNVIAAILKRLAHRNSNVQLYSFTLTESLSKNCGKELHSELASRAFTQALERLITDRNTHDKVRNRALMLVAMWAEDFAGDPTLGIMEECYESLKAKNYQFKPSDEPPPHDEEEARRREEEELQRVLELSIQDKGGRKNWNEYSLASSSGAGGSGSQASTQTSTALQRAVSSSPSSPAAAAAAAAVARNQTYTTGYVPSTEAQPQTQTPAYVTTVESSPKSTTSVPSSPTPSATEVYGVMRVRALHSFEPTEPNELAFERGDIIKVVNREYKDWWRGQIRGRTGIFPVNYVEPLPEPTPAELAAEAQQEAAVFSQAANVDRLLLMLRTLDPTKDNLADNEEIQELYRSCMTLRPKIVKLIDKYSQKRSDLVSMNESFVKARTIFDRMMEESLARHSEFYEQQRAPYPQPQSTYPRGESRGQGQQVHGYGRPADQPQAYAWNPSPSYDQVGYNVFPTPAPAYVQPRQDDPIPDPRVNLGRSGSYAAQQQTRPQPQGHPPSQQVQQGPQPQPQTAFSPPYSPQDNARASYYPQAQSQLAGPPLQPEQTLSPGQPQNQQPPPVPLQSHPQLHHAQQQPLVQSQPQLQATPSQTSVHVLPQSPTVAQQQPQVQVQTQTQTPHPPVVDTPAQAQAQPQPAQPQPQPDAQKQQQQVMTGPPYVYDPNATYPDPNAQAWAQYYAQGGPDPTGAVYFISVPGITDADSPQSAAAQLAEGQQQHPHHQYQQQLEQEQQYQQAAPASATPFSGPEPAPPAAAGRNNTRGHHQRQNSLPNPYGPSSPAVSDEAAPASAGGAGVGARAPWQATLPGQFTQMHVGEPSVGA